MEYAKIIVKNRYEKRGDLVLRSYIRALKKIEANTFLDGDNGLIYGTIGDDGNFREFFTREIIDYNSLVFVPHSEFVNIYFLPDQKWKLMRKINQKVLFNQDIDLNIEISGIEDLASDRAIEFEAYNNNLSIINPYQKLNENNINSYNDYNNFLVKIKAIKKIELNDSFSDSKDEYEVHSYMRRPENEIDYEYLIFEVPKILKK